jgi:hypothetical protein
MGPPNDISPQKLDSGVPSGNDFRESPPEPSRFLAEQFSHWSGRSEADVLPAVSAYLRYFATLTTNVDDRVPLTQLDKLNNRVAKEARAVVAQLRPIVAVGLQARVGRTLLPDAVLPEPHTRLLTADMQAWTAIELCLATLTAEVNGLCVCRSCTLVFAPERKRSARRCSLCKKRPAPPPLGMTGPAAPWAPGDSVWVRVARWDGNNRLPWGSTTIGVSTEARTVRRTRADGTEQVDYAPVDIFVGRADKKGSPADRKKRSRRLG